MAEEKKRRTKKVRQEWKPHWIIRLLYRLWMILFSAAKVALGAAATVLLICAVCVFVFVGILGDYLQEDIVPSANTDLSGYEVDQTSYVYYIDENDQIQLLQKVFTSADRQWADYEDIPENLIHAAIAIEDKRFYEHQGVDWFTTVKACAKMFFGDDSVGGSSITQQLIKNVTGNNSVTVQRKVQEIFQAAQFEKLYDKETVMEEYLNRIYLGNKCYGVRSAAATYFGKELEMLTLAECASLIGITNNPSIYDPYRAPFVEGGKSGKERNKERQQIILDQMLEQEWITEEEHDRASNQILMFKDGIDDEDRLAQCPNPECGYRNIAGTYIKDGENYYCPECNTQTLIVIDASQNVYSYFVDTALEDVARDLAIKEGVTEWNDVIQEVYMDKIKRGGYHIYTTLDMHVQDQMDSIYENLDNIPDTRSGQQLQSAMVIIDNDTGDIVALSGGVGEKIDHDGLNRATDSKLQSGSAIKPLSIYAPGFESGDITPASVVKDLPFVYEADRTPWPYNDTKTYSYSRSIISAVRASVNASATYALDLITTEYGYEFAKEKFGLTTLTDYYEASDGTIKSDIDYGPLAMGAQTIGVTVRDMANAYSTFANNGVWREARTYLKVYDSEGNVVLDNTQDSREVLSEKAVTYMNYCLVSAASAGTGSAANIHTTQLAGKTGSTSSYRDRWFCAFTHYYTAAVWCGYDTPEVISVTDGSGGHPAVTMWRRVLKPLHEDVEWVSVYSRRNLSEVSICLDSGKLATEACGLDVRTEKLKRTESIGVYREDRPTEKCDVHVMVDYCTDGVANEYCKHFAEVDPSVVISQKALVKITEEQFEEIKKAGKFKLNEEFLRDDYVYLVTKKGKDAVFTGFKGDINKGVEAPYKVCTVHTKEAWEAYQQSQIPEPTDPEDPTAPELADLLLGLVGIG